MPCGARVSVNGAAEPALAASHSVHLEKLAGVAGEIGCSAFVAFAWLNRLERLSPDAARHIAADRAAVYDWYVRIYAPSQAPAPLSAADVDWLLADVALPGIAFHVPRVVSWFTLVRTRRAGGLFGAATSRPLRPGGAIPSCPPSAQILSCYRPAILPFSAVLPRHRKTWLHRGSHATPSMWRSPAR